LDLIKKYGEGKKLEKKCINCGTATKIRTSGVHISDNGCIGVFSDDDDFECSDCGYKGAGTTFMCIGLFQKTSIAHPRRKLTLLPPSDVLIHLLLSGTIFLPSPSGRQKFPPWGEYRSFLEQPIVNCDRRFL
jgi:hypothetical protein